MQCHRLRRLPLAKAGRAGKAAPAEKAAPSKEVATPAVKAINDAKEAIAAGPPGSVARSDAVGKAVNEMTREAESKGVSPSEATNQAVSTIVAVEKAAGKTTTDEATKNTQTDLKGKSTPATNAARDALTDHPGIIKHNAEVISNILAPELKGTAKEAPAEKGAPTAPAQRGTAKEAPAEKGAPTAPAEKGTAKEAPAERGRTTPAEKGTAKEAPAEKGPTKETPAEKATPVEVKGEEQGAPAAAPAPARHRTSSGAGTCPGTCAGSRTAAGQDRQRSSQSHHQQNAHRPAGQDFKLAWEAQRQGSNSDDQRRHPRRRQ